MREMIHNYKSLPGKPGQFQLIDDCHLTKTICLRPLLYSESTSSCCHLNTDLMSFRPPCVSSLLFAMPSTIIITNSKRLTQPLIALHKSSLNFLHVTYNTSNSISVPYSPPYHPHSKATRSGRYVETHRNPTDSITKFNTHKNCNAVWHGTEKPQKIFSSSGLPHQFGQHKLKFKQFTTQFTTLLSFLLWPGNECELQKLKFLRIFRPRMSEEAEGTEGVEQGWNS